DSTQLFFEQPESKLESEHPWPPVWISQETGNSAFFLSNARQFLDEPGEWYLDESTHKIYYWPRHNEALNEDLTTANVVAPFTETLLKLNGVADHPLRNVFIRGISFQYTTWLRPGLEGHVPLQEGMYLTNAYKLKPAGTKENPHLDNQSWI